MADNMIYILNGNHIYQLHSMEVMFPHLYVCISVCPSVDLSVNTISPECLKIGSLKFVQKHFTIMLVSSLKIELSSHNLFIW